MRPPKPSASLLCLVLLVSGWIASPCGPRVARGEGADESRQFEAVVAPQRLPGLDVQKCGLDDDRRPVVIHIDGRRYVIRRSPGEDRVTVSIDSEPALASHEAARDSRSRDQPIVIVVPLLSPTVEPKRLPIDFESLEVKRARSDRAGSSELGRRKVGSKDHGTLHYAQSPMRPAFEDAHVQRAGLTVPSRLPAIAPTVFLADRRVEWDLVSQNHISFCFRNASLSEVGSFFHHATGMTVRLQIEAVEALADGPGIHVTCRDKTVREGLRAVLATCGLGYSVHDGELDVYPAEQVGSTTDHPLIQVQEQWIP